MAISPPNDALLCERCGYDMSSLGLARPCPECGANVAGDTARRSGSPAQRSIEGARARDCVWVLNSPRFTFTAILVDGVSGNSLYRLSVSRAAVLVALAPVLVVLGFVLIGDFTHRSTVWVTLAKAAFLLGLAFPVGFVVVFALLCFLCWLEFQGVQFFGRQRGWRVTPEVADSVIAHAAVGWLAGGVLWSVGCVIVFAGFVWLRPLSLFSADVRVTALLALPFVGLFVGLLIFESLVYLGIRACRFANPPAVVARYLTPAENLPLRATPGATAE